LRGKKKLDEGVEVVQKGSRFQGSENVPATLRGEGRYEKREQILLFVRRKRQKKAGKLPSGRSRKKRGTSRGRAEAGGRGGQRCLLVCNGVVGLSGS